MTAPDPTTPREPEIELLGRIARHVLWGLRRVLWLVGATAVGFGVHSCVWLGTPVFVWFVWFAGGLPLLAPIDWILGRGRLVALSVGAFLWFLPSLLAGDQDHGWVLRVFASLVAVATLLVWRTLWRLTLPAAEIERPIAP
jgi:hypothetical protein